jgi:hypothetical protein
MNNSVVILNYLDTLRKLELISFLTRNNIGRKRLSECSDYVRETFSRVT